MNDEEAREYRISIANALRSDGFDWVVNEVQSVITAGQLIDKEVEEITLPRTSFDASDADESELRRSRRRATRSSTIPFSEQEQLEILSTAIERAVPDRAEIQEATFETIIEFDVIHFVPETGDIEEPSHLWKSYSMTRHEDAQANVLAARTRSLLLKLRKLLDAS
jgi:hypothetical protein